MAVKEQYLCTKLSRLWEIAPTWYVLSDDANTAND
jgi:hypothetical protein